LKQLIESLRKNSLKKQRKEKNYRLNYRKKSEPDTNNWTLKGDKNEKRRKGRKNH